MLPQPQQLASESLSSVSFAGQRNSHVCTGPGTSTKTQRGPGWAVTNGGVSLPADSLGCSHAARATKRGCSARAPGKRIVLNAPELGLLSPRRRCPSRGLEDAAPRLSARASGDGWETSRSGAGSLALCQALGCSPACPQAALNKAACDLHAASASPSRGAGTALLPAPPLCGPARPAGPWAGAVPGAGTPGRAGAEPRP